MLEHCKIVLNGVKDEKNLFRKELIKSLAWLNEEEQRQLGQWVRKNFHEQHAEIIDEILFTKYNLAS